jgi:hypothetical protein
MMETLNLINISWLGFFVILLILVGLEAFYYIVLKRILRNVSRIGPFKIHALFLDRLVLLGSVFIATLCFIAVNPLVHGIIVGFLVLLFFPSIRQLVKGLFFLLESRAVRGKVVELQGKRGVIQHLGWTTMSINSDGKSHLVPYGKIHDEGISFSDSSSSSRLHTILCDPKSPDQKLSEIQEEIKRILFTFPFINYHVRPRIDQENERIKLVFALSDDIYLPGLINMIRETNVQTQTMN